LLFIQCFLGQGYGLFLANLHLAFIA